MTDSDFDRLRDKAREKINKGEWLAEIPISVLGDDNIQGKIPCSLCGIRLEPKEFRYLVRVKATKQDGQKDIVLHFDCHAAWLREVIESRLRRS